LPYAPTLPAALADALGLDGRGRLLDVGCGPGVVTLLLAPHFEQVLGLDPDPDMLAVAARRADELGVAHADWVRMRAEELPADLGRFRVITFAASFHWMDRPAVARAVRTMLDPEGAVVQIHAPAPNEPAPPGRPPNVPQSAMTALRQAYLGTDIRAGQSIRNSSPDGEDAVFQAAGFRPADVIVVPDGRCIEHNADEVVALVFSMASTTPHLFGERMDDFERDLRTALHRASPSDRFSYVLGDNELRIWRPLADE
jgi:SAM-dependent methyltransferase